VSRVCDESQMDRTELEPEPLRWANDVWPYGPSYGRRFRIYV